MGMAMKQKTTRQILEEVRDEIIRHAENFDMFGWIRSGGMPGYGNPIREHCGTTACIAGFVCFANGCEPDGIDRVISDGGELMDVETQAVAILDLPYLDCNALFHIEMWPEDLQARYSGTPQDKAGIAAERINQFIEEQRLV